MLVPINPKKAPQTTNNSEYRIRGSLEAGEIIVERSDQVVPRVPSSGDFDENLAEKMERGERMKIAQLLSEYADTDIQSRKDWEDREKKGLEMCGLKDMPSDSPNAPGVHKTIHPLMAEALVQFQARAVTELFPPTGPVKCAVTGDDNKELLERRDRVEKYMNYYLCYEDKGYFANSDQMLFYLPLSGSAFRKCAPSWITGKPELRYVKAIDFIANYEGQDLQTMPRYAHKFSMNSNDIMQGQALGILLDDATLVAPAPGTTSNSKTSDLGDQRIPTYHDNDEVYPMLEYHVMLDLDVDEWGLDEKADYDQYGNRLAKFRPYIVLVEITNHEVLAIRRNWEEQDPLERKKILFAHYKFLPGVGFYGAGLPHIIGSLQLSATGAVNALLDSAFASNFQGGFAAKGSKMAGEMVLEHGKWKRVEMTQEELSKSFYTPPFKEPSNALANMLGVLVEAGRRFAGTTDVNVGDQSSQNAPVGTTLALIEQASKPQSAIHKRLHDSLKQELEILFKAIRDYIPEEYPYTVAGEQRTVMASDFSDDIDITPVSDPNIYSSTQRIAIAQAVLQLQQQAPDLYKRDQRVAAHVMMLRALRVPDIDSIQPDDPTMPVNMDPVTENAEIFQGHPVKTFPTQDDMAHIAVHQNGLQYAQGMMDEETFQHVFAVMQAHIAEHTANLYRKQAFQAAGIPLPPDNPDGTPQEQPPDIERTITHLVVNQLPAPPMSQQQQAEAQKAQQHLTLVDAKVQAKQMETQAEIQRKDALAAAEARRKDALAHTEIERDTTAFVADQAREQQSHVREEKRKDQAAASKVTREAAQASVKLNAQSKSAQVKHAAEIEGTKQKLRGAHATHAQQMQHTDEKHRQSQSHAQADHQQSLQHGQEDHKQTLSQSTDTHKQGMEHAQETHRQGVAHESDSHKREMSRSEKSHALDLRHQRQTMKQQAQSKAKTAKKAKKPKGK